MARSDKGLLVQINLNRKLMIWQWHEAGTGVEDIRLGNRGYGNGRLYGKDGWWCWVESYWWLFVTISKAFWHSDTCAAVLSLRLFPLNTSGNMRWHDTVACSPFIIISSFTLLWFQKWARQVVQYILKWTIRNAHSKSSFSKLSKKAVVSKMTISFLFWQMLVDEKI